MNYANKTFGYSSIDLRRSVLMRSVEPYKSIFISILSKVNTKVTLRTLTVVGDTWWIILCGTTRSED